MRITISGVAGAGKSTIAKLLSKKLGLKHYSTGDYMRDMAKKRGITLGELGEIAEKNRDIDDELDDWQKKIDVEKDNFVMDSRLGWHFIHNALKIFLDCKLDITMKRILGDNSISREIEKKTTDLESTKKKIIERAKSEKKRYKELYGIDYYDKKNYDLIVDTSGKTKEQVVDEISEYIQNHYK